jgi:hypothetical protein
MTMRDILRCIASALLLSLAIDPALAQNTDTYFQTPGGSGVAGSGIGMCLTTTNPLTAKAVPCSDPRALPSPSVAVGPESLASLPFVNGQPSTLFVDDFGAGTLNTSTRWMRSITGGGGNATGATNAVGQTTIGTGTSPNGWAVLTGMQTFPDRNPAYNYFQENINLPIPSVKHAYMLFGLLAVPYTAGVPTPTLATPAQNAAAFEFGTDGKLRAVTFASGGPEVIVADLSVAQGTTPVQTAPGVWTGGCGCTPQISAPKGGSGLVTDSFKYVADMRGDNIVFYTEQPSGALALVAYTTRGAVGLDVNQVPVGHLVMADATGPSSTATMQINQTTVGDTGKNIGPSFDRLAYPQQALTAVNDAVGVNSMGASSCAFTAVSNTNVTLVFEQTDPNGTNWTPVTAYPSAGGPGIQTVPSGTNGQWVVPCGGFNQVRMRVSAIGATPTVLGTAEASLGQNIIGPSTSDPCSYGAKLSAPINITSATTTSLIALSGTTSVYVCGFSVSISQVVTTPNTIQFEFGTGAACVTTQTVLTGLFGGGGVTAAAPITISYGGGNNTMFKAPAGNAICAVTAIGASGSFQGVLTYVQQ